MTLSNLDAGNIACHIHSKNYAIEQNRQRKRGASYICPSPPLFAHDLSNRVALFLGVCQSSQVLPCQFTYEGYG